MLFKIQFTVDSGVKHENHVAIIQAPNINNAMYVFDRDIYNYPYMKGNDVIITDVAIDKIEEEKTILYSTMEEEK